MRRYYLNRRRELYMQKGKQFLKDGKVNEARDAFTKCISVTPKMALDVMKVITTSWLLTISIA